MDVRRAATRCRAAAARPEAGSGTVLAIGVVAGVATVLVTALVLASVLVAGQQARSAADLAALAGMGRVVSGYGEPDACAVAARVARDNGGHLSGCRTVPADGEPWPRLRVTVTRAVAGTPWTTTAEAVSGGVPRDG